MALGAFLFFSGLIRDPLGDVAAATLLRRFHSTVHIDAPPIRTTDGLQLLPALLQLPHSDRSELKVSAVGKYSKSPQLYNSRWWFVINDMTKFAIL